MYRKIWGLKQLERLGFPYPPYQVICITEDKPENVKKYILGKIRQLDIPLIKGDRIGVTIRVSMPGDLDKIGKHGGLHLIEEEDILKRILAKSDQYKPWGRIVIQHTVDAICSGAILKETEQAIIEAIFGDAPPLFEGSVTDYERWSFDSRFWSWKKEKACVQSDKKVAVLTPSDIEKLETYLILLPCDVYLEWSVSKSGKIYFYEYYKLKNRIR